MPEIDLMAASRWYSGETLAKWIAGGGFSLDNRHGLD
jgi:hypothetical protein